MCGRFNLTASPEQLAAHFQLPRLPHFEASYNIAPGQKILAVVELENLRLKAVNLQWGLIPSWTKDSKISQHLINARAETLLEKPSFRTAFRQRRCLIPATGFYEWQALADHKQAYHIHRHDNGLFAFAGLWEHWQQDNTAIYSCAIITTTATSVMRPIHERMPVIIAETDYRRWLDRQTPTELLTQLLEHSGYQHLSATAVSNWVNNPRHNDPSCLDSQDYSNQRP